MAVAPVISKRLFWILCSGLLIAAVQGCVATRDWVRENIAPLAGRVSGAEDRLGTVENRVSGTEGRLGEVDVKADKALNRLANLRLQRRFVLDLKEGANFAFNSAVLTDEAKKEIDGFLSDLKGDLKDKEGVVFLIAGHTDNMGPEDYNYELGRRRAEGVARYLIIQRKMDPLRVMTVSYGKNAPLVDNGTREGRQKNRRVEILVYSEGITTAAAEEGSTARVPAPQGPEQRVSRN